MHTIFACLFHIFIARLFSSTHVQGANGRGKESTHTPPMMYSINKISFTQTCASSFQWMLKIPTSPSCLFCTLLALLILTDFFYYDLWSFSSDQQQQARSYGAFKACITDIHAPQPSADVNNQHNCRRTPSVLGRVQFARDGKVHNWIWAGEKSNAIVVCRNFGGISPLRSFLCSTQQMIELFINNACC